MFLFPLINLPSIRITNSSAFPRITGACGTWPGTAITGFGAGAGVCTGGIDAGNTAAQNAEAACLTAYNLAASFVPTTTLPTNPGGLTLVPGVYNFTTLNAGLSGTLTLNGASNPHGQFIFEVKTTFVPSALAKVVLTGGAQACNVYWIVGSSATIGAGAQLQGNILAYTSVSVGSAVSNKGTLCALNGGITLIDDALTAQPTCST